MNKIELVINPTLVLREELIDLLVKFKVKTHSFRQNEEVLMDLYDLMCLYFSENVIDEILTSCMNLDEIRHLKLKKIIE